MNLLDLPDELLEHIIHYLDADATAATAVTNCRLFGACVRSCVRVKIHTLTKQMCDSVGSSLQRIQLLDLTNCHSRSSYIAALIARCPQLRELNVVNSGLASRNLLKVIKNASNLEVLSFSSFDELTKESVAEILGGTNSILRKVYIECPSRSDSLASNLSILEHCQNLQFLHINLVGRALKSDSWYAWFSLLTEMRVDAEFRNLNSFIVSCHLSDPRVRMRLITMLNNVCRATARLVSMRTHSQTLRHVANLFNVTEFLCLEDGSTIAEKYRIDFANPRAEQLGFRIPLDLAQNVVELDLTTHHCEFREAYWRNLVESAPHLEALAVPVCFIPQEGSLSEASENTNSNNNTNNNTTNNNNRNDNDDDDEPAKTTSKTWDVAKILSAVKLKKLLVTGVPLMARRRHMCMRCEKSQNFTSMGRLEQLSHLEEFTLCQVDATAEAFNALANANVKTMKLCFSTVENVNGLQELVSRCARLTHLKLEANNLPLHSAALWDALASRDNFRQLCLSSRNLDAIEPTMVVDKLANLTKRLEVLHLHMNVRQLPLIKAMKNYLRKLNAEKWPEQLHFTETSLHSLSAVHIVDVPISYPGRALCCSANFISKIETVGWNT